jgi:glycosyltransferase involved in cell wall biosynthesis
MSKKRLLYISTWIPGSAAGGTEARAANHIRVLSRLFDVTLAIVGNHGSEAEVRERLAPDLNRVCASVVVANCTSAINRLLQKTRGYRTRLLLESLWPTPIIVAPYRPALAELARRLAGERFDVVHCFRLNAGLLRVLKGHGITFSRSVLDLDSYESQAEFRSIIAFRPLIGTQSSAVNLLKAAKWWFLESLLVPSFDDAIVCSESDRQNLRRRFPGSRWHVVPNTVAEPSEFRVLGSDQFTFLFVGQLGYLPNWDAVVFFCTHVLPILRCDAPGRFRVLIVGRSGGDLDRLARIEEVQVIVNAPHLAPYYAQSDVAIVPLRGGGGTRVKILEALSYGLAVVSTTIGAEGLEVTPGSDILIADRAEDFAAQCLRIWRDDVLRQQIGAAGYDLWRIKYSSAALVAALNGVYEGER